MTKIIDHYYTDINGVVSEVVPPTKVMIYYVLTQYLFVYLMNKGFLLDRGRSRQLQWRAESLQTFLARTTESPGTKIIEISNH